MIQKSKGRPLSRPLRIRKIAEGLARLNFLPTFVSTQIAIAVVMDAQAIRGLDVKNGRR